MPAVLLRRRLLALSASALLGPGVAACRRVPRCASCGMVLDPTSRWYTELVEGGTSQGFDTPKCALRRRLSHAPSATLFARSYYRQQRVSGDAVVFAAGSDVLGPMGADLVPVEPEHADKFRAEHHAQQLLTLPQITLALVEAT